MGEKEDATAVNNQLDGLKRDRRSLKRELTVFYNNLPDTPPVDDQEALKSELACIKLTRDKFLLIHSQIEEMEGEEDDQTYEEFNTKFHAAVGAATKLLKPVETVSNTVTNTAPPAPRPIVREETITTQVKLPQIELPRFNGELDKWNEFHDTFLSLVHNCDSISEVCKFRYLKSALSGKAADVISALPVTAANYAGAWKSLQARFDNKRLTVKTHIQAILSIPKTHKETAVALRQITDVAKRHLEALKALGRPTDQWNDIIVPILGEKMDPASERAWESQLKRDTLPTIEELLTFLADRCDVLETTQRNHPAVSDKPINSNHGRKALSASLRTKLKCYLCEQSHNLYACAEFRTKTLQERINFVREKGLCFNCMRSKHRAEKCESGSCRICFKKHHTLLHLDGLPVTASCTQNSLIETTLLATAVVCLRDANGQPRPCRILLDSGAQSNFVTSNFAKKLMIKTEPVNIPMSGINQSRFRIRNKINTQLTSRNSNYKVDTCFLLLDEITQDTPSRNFNPQSLNIPKDVVLADPEFYKSRNIDGLIGIGLFWDLLLNGNIRLKHGLFLTETHLGWILSGGGSSCLPSSCHLVSTNLNDQVEKFWLQEEVPPTTTMSSNDLFCEAHFGETHHRNNEGRFIVKLPFKSETTGSSLGDSKTIAMKQFLALERRLSRDKELQQQYALFMKEYCDMGHMKEVPETNNVEPYSYYLPHHAVLKEESLTTKLRVVFNASSRTSSGKSLNDLLHVGPVLQSDLFDILARFRMHNYVLTADISKMYRQILLHPEQRRLHRVLWRPSSEEKIRTFELQTLTYGTAPASYLATKCLQQLAQDEKDVFSTGATIVRRDFYMDDLLTGAATLEELEDIRYQVEGLLLRGCFELRKWASNESKALKGLTESKNDYALNLAKDDVLKTLGLFWNPVEDKLRYSVKKVSSNSRTTKRSILSEVAQLFDPLGLIGPVIAKAKIFIQDIWKLKLDWDAAIPSNIEREWREFRDQLKHLESLHIPRQCNNRGSYHHVELHGFSDASQKAYGASIYIVTYWTCGISAKLVCSKSRVAPIKSVSIPRLELCGALVMAKLLQKVRQALLIDIDAAYCWTDSTIVLSWLKGEACNWKTYVSNRVSEIQTLTLNYEWRHVPTLDNPADLISRGLMPNEIKHSRLWWKGPAWLELSDAHWPETLPSLDSPPERKTTATVGSIGLVTSTNSLEELTKRYSNFDKLKRVFAYIRRFASNCRPRSVKNRGPLTVEDIDKAECFILKLIQATEFQAEISNLASTGSTERRSPLKTLNPFLDDDGVLRVGGRLRHSQLNYNHKFPAILPKGHYLSWLLIMEEHIRVLHGGSQLTLSSIRQRYWPLGGKGKVRQVLKRCYTCCHVNPKPLQPLMGNLPAPRVTISRPFENVGIDYCRPFHIKEGNRRSVKVRKAYVAVFTCFATKAVHVELVSDLTTEAFLAALKRFLGRRGIPSNIYSDNGTNFVGAANEIQRMLQDPSVQATLTNRGVSIGIKWHFIPPRAPTFGGLWEAAVKSVKTHLKRTIGESRLTFEELATLLIEIEAVLNSRPITALSEDSRDLDALTPGHLLIGQPLSTLPTQSLLHENVNRLSRWQHIQFMKEQFWRRWKQEYLHMLQQRPKRLSGNSINLKPGQLVLIKEESVPLMWPRGRVEELHPGDDGIARVATIRTQKGLIKRSVNKLCLLPTE